MGNEGGEKIASTKKHRPIESAGSKKQRVVSLALALSRPSSSRHSESWRLGLPYSPLSSSLQRHARLSSAMLVASTCIACCGYLATVKRDVRRIASPKISAGAKSWVNAIPFITGLCSLLTTACTSCTNDPFHGFQWQLWRQVLCCALRWYTRTECAGWWR